MRTEEGDWTASRHISEGHLVAQGTAKGDTQEKKQDTKRLCRVDMRARHTHAGQRAKPRRSDTRWGGGVFPCFFRIWQDGMHSVYKRNRSRSRLFIHARWRWPPPSASGVSRPVPEPRRWDRRPGTPGGTPRRAPTAPTSTRPSFTHLAGPVASPGTSTPQPPAKCVPNPCISQPDRLSARRPAPPAQSCRPMSPEGLGENSAHLSDDPTCSSHGPRQIFCVVIRLCPGPYVQLPPPPGFILTNRTLSLMRRVCISGSC